MHACQTRLLAALASILLPAPGCAMRRLHYFEHESRGRSYTIWGLTAVSLGLRMGARGAGWDARADDFRLLVTPIRDVLLFTGRESQPSDSDPAEQAATVKRQHTPPPTVAGHADCDCGEGLWPCTGVFAQPAKRAAIHGTGI